MTSRINEISNLVQELSRCGAYISENHIAFQGESDSNVGMYAASEIKAGTILMGIPAHTILIPRVGHESKAGNALLRICRETGDGSEHTMISRKHTTFLALAILEGLDTESTDEASENDENGCTKHHIKSLPKVDDLTTMPVFWSNEDRSILRNCCNEFDILVEKESKVWRDEYQLLSSLLKEEFSFPYTLQQWLWVRANIVSRNMQIPSKIFNSVFEENEEVSEVAKPLSKSQKKRNRKKKHVQAIDETIPILVPLADMANHSSSPTVTWRLDPVEKMFEMKAMKLINEGEELCFDYGPQASSKYLLHYGFLPHDQSRHCKLETTLTTPWSEEKVVIRVGEEGFQTLMCLCRRHLVENKEEAELLKDSAVILSRDNEGAALELAHELLRGRLSKGLQCIRFIDQNKSTSQVAPSITALIQAENVFLRSLIRVAEDASLYLCGGDEALDIMKEYSPENWIETKQVWKKHVQFAPTYFATLAQIP